MTKFKVENHILVSKHLKLSDKEKKDLLEKYNITTKELPIVIKKDPAIKALNVRPGDVIKIIRKSPTAGEAVFYRYVVNA